MAEATAQNDLRTLMQSSPALKTLRAEDFQKLLDSTSALSQEKQDEIVGILEDEQGQLKAMKTEYDQKRVALFRDFLDQMKIEEKKMVRGFQETVESIEKGKETQILDQLLTQLN